ncbi:MAG: endolytic transglycosylase MltG [Anaerolineae bacterium]
MFSSPVAPRPAWPSTPAQSKAAPLPILLALLLLLAFLLASCGGDTLAVAYLEANRGRLEQPADPAGTPRQFVVQPGSTARVIAENLAGAGLITDPRLFEAYVRVNGLAPHLQAGTYQLSPSMTIPQIAEALQNARGPEIVVRVGEGWRLEQTADFLSQRTPLDGAEYRQRALAGDLSGLDAAKYGFLALRPAGASLEGFLYPDTYRLPAEGATALDLIGRQLDNFAEKVLPAWQGVQDTAPVGLTLYQVLTLASIVEREAAVDDERPLIAGVYLNRLARGMKLQADPTVQYALGYQPDTGRWWKTPVYLEEYERVDSPYNTYKVTGLPPGPICSPGLKSIQAVLAPAGHEYLYFVAEPGGTGRHAFAETYEEHLENVRRYREGATE